MYSISPDIASRKRNFKENQNMNLIDLKPSDSEEENKIPHIESSIKINLSSLRKGKWTPEEEIYANKIITYFNLGLLNIPAGSTLRCFLSEKLNW